MNKNNYLLIIIASILVLIGNIFLYKNYQSLAIILNIIFVIILVYSLYKYKNYVFDGERK